MFRVFITRRLPGDVAAVLRGQCAVDAGEQDGAIDRGVLLERVRGVDALVAFLTDKIDAEVMDAAGPQLRLVANFAVGVDNIDRAEAAKRGIMVSNTPGVLTETTADLAWALILAAARRVAAADRFVRAGRFEGWDPNLLLGVDVWGKTLGLVGAGRIGLAVARRARGFEMTVLYTKRRRLAVAEERRFGLHYVSLPELLQRVDFVSIHCPLTAETHHLISAAELSLLRPTAVLVNTARGPVIDEEALVSALRAGHIFAAGLDVYEGEPKVARGLIGLPNTVLLPHVGSASRETRERMARMNAGDVLRVARGEPPVHLVAPPENLCKRGGVC